jgi:hypothetical protein
MDKMKTLKVATWIVMAATLVVFIISAYNLVSFIGALLSPASAPSLKLTQTPGTEDYILNLSTNPTNTGFLGVDLSTKLTIFNADGKVVDSNITSMSVPPGQNRSCYVSLTITKAMAPEGNIQNMKASVQFELEVRTLWNLVGFKNVMKTGSGQE